MARILVAEDDIATSQLIVRMLEPFGHSATCTTDGTQTLEAIVRDAPELVLLDVMMPNLDGFQVLERVPGELKLADLPVVLVTAADNREHRLRGFELGASDFLGKPIDWPLLITRVENLLRLRQTTLTLEERNRQLITLQLQQRDLTSFLVHDLKSPLAVISSSLDWLRSAHLEGEARDALNDARSNVTRILDMIGDLLTIAKMEEPGGMVVKPEPMSLREMISECVASRQEMARARGLSLSCEVPGPGQADLDTRLFRRVLDNLLDNALKYTPRDGRVQVQLDARDAIVLAICNDGPAIPVEERPGLFERFRRGRNAPASNRSVGLGLYFCRLVVETHGGALSVEERPGWPTCFVVRLPRS